MTRRILLSLGAVLFLLLVVSVPVLSGSVLSVFLPISLRAPESPTPTSTATPTNTPTSSPTSTATLHPTIAPTRTPNPSGDVKIISIFANGSGDNEPNEYVAIRNDDNHAIQLQGWTLRDIADHVFTFPSFVMAPDQVCRVYTNEYHPEWCGFSYGSNSAIWNNSGDCGYLRDSTNTLMDDYCY